MVIRLTKTVLSLVHKVTLGPAVRCVTRSNGGLE